MEIKVLAGQSLIDIADRYTGTELSAFAISVANGISLTDDLEPGQILIIPEELTTDIDVLSYYKREMLQPATAIALGQDAAPPEGIGFWIIERNFKVS